MLPPRTTLPGLDERLSIGRGGALRVSPFCVGIVDEPDAVLHAFDRGINFFFISADLHWPLYEATRAGVARLLARGSGMRDRIVVAAASYCTQPEFVSSPALELLEMVPALERIDILVAGGAYGHEIDTRLDAYRALLERGHAGASALAVTFHDRDAAARALRQAAADIVYIRYNPSHPRARDLVFPAVSKPGTPPLYGFKSTSGWIDEPRLRELGIGDHHWRPRLVDYYRFALSSAEMDGLLCSPSTPDEIDAFADALNEGPLSDREVAYLLDLADLDAGRTRLKP